MKRVFTSQNGAEAGVLQSMLEATGIPCLIRKDYVAPNLLRAFQPELWVVKDEHFMKAQDLCERWRYPSVDRPPYWMCPSCGAGSEDQFSSCWKCGKERHARS